MCSLIMNVSYSFIKSNRHIVRISRRVTVIWKMELFFYANIVIFVHMECEKRKWKQINKGRKRSSFVNNLMSFFFTEKIFFHSLLHFTFFLFISRGVKNVIYGSALHLLNELTAYCCYCYWWWRLFEKKNGSENERDKQQ